jgi:hypothetical protein
MYIMKKYTFNLKNGSVIEMSLDEISRWACLLEGIEVVTRHNEELGIDSEKDSDWIKPLAFQKYMDERFEAMRHDIKVETMLGRL